MAKCFVCRKGIMRGNQVSHSAIKTKKIFKPNLHPMKIKFADKNIIKIKLCSKCYKKIKNDFWQNKTLAFTPLSLLNQKRIQKPAVLQVESTKVEKKTKKNGQEKGTKN